MRSPGAKIGVGRFGKRRASLGLVGVVAAAIELSIAIPACLNPRPEELPSHEDQPFEPEPAPGLMSERESCSDNPLLTGCSLPDEDVNGAPISSPAAEPEAPVPLGDTFDVSDSPDDADAGIPGDAGL